MSDQERLVGHVFISYVREDSLNVDRLQYLLQTAGVRVWRDTADLWPGEDWRDKIRQAITNNALVFLVCFSHNSIARERSYQNEELALAIDQMRLRRPGEPWLIPIRFDDCYIPDISIGAGRSLGSIQRADLFGDRFAENASRLVGAVQRILQHHRLLNLSDAKNSARETHPVIDIRSSDECADDRAASNILSSVHPPDCYEWPLEMRDAVQVDAGWALWGKPPNSMDDYSVLACSDEPFSRAEFTQLLTRFTPGIPSTATRGPGALPWVTISRAGLSESSYPGITVQTATDTVDGTGRAIIQSSYFCIPYSDLASAPISYTDLYRATAKLQLQSYNGNSIQITMPRLNPEELARGISEFGESAVATTAALLISGPVTIIRAGQSTLQERLWFIEAVAALLPYGYRADYTAATWSDNWYHHQIRLAFAEQSTEYTQSVRWREPNEDLTGNPIAQEFLTELDRLRRRYSGLYGLAAIIERLAEDTEPRRFGQMQPAISSLLQFELPDSYPERSKTRTSTVSRPQTFASRRVSALGQPRPPHPANARNVSTEGAGEKPGAGETEADARRTHNRTRLGTFVVRHFRLSLGSQRAEAKRRAVPGPGSAPQWFIGPTRGRRGRKHTFHLTTALVATAVITLAAASGDSALNVPGSSHPSTQHSTHVGRSTWSILEPAPIITFPIPKGMIPESVAFGVRGTLAIATTVTQGHDGSVYLQTPAMGNHLKPLRDPGSHGTNVVVFNPAGTVLAVGDANGRTYLRNAVSGSLITPSALSDPQSLNVLALAFSPDGATLAVADENGTVYLWDVATRRQLSPLPPNPDGAGLEALAFGPDNILAVGDYNGNVYLWNVLNRAHSVLTDPDPDSHVQALAFGNGGAVLAAGDANGKTYLWKIIRGTSGTVVGTLIRSLADPGTAGVEAVAFSPDSATLAIGDTNRSAYLWHVATHKITARLHVPAEAYGVSSVAFSPDGTTVAIGDHAGGAYLWYLTKAML